jgi:hypothetical protein
VVAVSLVDAGSPAPIVHGDHFRIGFVLETLIAALVRFAPEEEPVEARMATRDGRALVELSGFLPDLADGDHDGSRLVALQRADIWLARPLVTRFMADHGGTVFEEAGTDGRVRFVLDFPALEGQSP